MRVRLLLAALLLSVSLNAASDGRTELFREAVSLYNAGMYERAASLFDRLKGEAVSDGYALLCAIKMRSSGLDALVADYEEEWETTPLSSQIDWEYGRVLFDAARYSDAAGRLRRVDPGKLEKVMLPELAFKQGYCDYVAGLYADARTSFLKVEDLPMSDYKAPARYGLGFMAYSDKDFAEAQKWFELSAADPRFEQLSKFYLVDCHFMQKDYDYVLSEGVEQFGQQPEQRRNRLARMISESYLVRGEKEKAKEYYAATAKDNMNRADWFYAGSVLYAVEDWPGAIENFCNMRDRTDSLGQIANYQLANAYLKTGNNVGAMNAFKDASEVKWNPAMQEDALFNYAKLAFDLNKDTKPFARYIADYSTSRRGDEIYSYMALASLYNRDYVGAVEAYDKIDELSQDQQNNYVKAYYLRGEQLIASGAYTDAIPCLKAAAYYLPKHDKINQLARYWQAEACYRSENYEEAAKIFADLYNLSALEGEAEGKVLSYNVAYSHLKNKEYNSAARWFDIYLNEGDKAYRKDALLRRADCDYVQRNYSQAVNSYKNAIKEIGVSEDIYPYCQLALCYGLTGDKKSKAEALSFVMKADPETPMYAEGLYELGRAYMDISENVKAMNAFSLLRDNASDKETKAKALIGIGMVSRNTSDYDRALSCYKEVVRLLPGSQYAEDAMFAIESIYQALHTPEKYLEYVEENNLASGKSESDKENLYFNTAEQVYLSGNYVQAAASLQKYLDSYPEGSHVTNAIFYLAESYAALGNKEKACDYYNKVIEAPDAGSFAESSMLRSAELNFSLERFSAAYDAYLRLRDNAKLDDNRVKALYGMMRSAYKARSYAEAADAAGAVEALSGQSESLLREASYIKAKSLLSCSRRDEALAEFRKLSAQPSTDEGAEACYILIQDAFDRADYTAVQQKVFDFSGKAGGQNYWLARCYVTLADTFVQQEKKDQAKATLQSILDGYTPERQDDDILDLVRARLNKLN